MSHEMGRGATSLVAGIASVFVTLALAGSADAAIPSVFSATAAPIPCAVQPSGVRLCDETIAGNPGGPARSTVKTFDGVPIDVRVAFPPAPTSGPDGPYPLIMVFHGWAQSKRPIVGKVQSFLDSGYATFAMTERGFGETCGTQASRDADSAGCARGYIHVMDTRYEVRDAQELAGLLADEGRISSTQIGAFGGSYGGGASMALAALKDRKMLPDGTLVPWLSPGGTPMRIAAAIPQVPWTDLAYSLLPNGNTLDYVDDAPDRGRTGVLKASHENQVYAADPNFRLYAQPGTDPDADFTGWHTTWNTVDPYDDSSGNPLPASADIRDELTTHHSSYYIDHSEPPAPLLIASGFTDDLFPADEAIRYYNRTRTQYSNADISLFFMNFGHSRARPRAADQALLSADQQRWIDYYVKGVGSKPELGVKTLTQTCPDTVPSAGPFYAPDWAHVSAGEVPYSWPAAQTILPTAGDSAISSAFDLSGGGACATTSSADQAGAATYRTGPVPGGGYTLMGSPTVIADITSAGSSSQIAARLLDVDAATGNQTLIARAMWRPAIGPTAIHQVFQLHPNGYNFAAGHVVKLELLPKDANYARTSALQQDITVSNLELRLPVRERPGDLNGLVRPPAKKLLPLGYQLARDFTTAPYVRPKGATPVYVSLVPAFAECTSPTRMHAPPLTYGSCPAQQASDFLTVGTPDANGRAARSSGFVNLQVTGGDPSTPADEADVVMQASLTDVLNKNDLSDYTGELQVSVTTRIVDRFSGSNAAETATTLDQDFAVTVPCAAVPDEIGATCAATTSLDAVLPGSILEGGRSIRQLDRVEVYDGGADGTAAGPNTLFAVQGLFAP